MANPQAVKRNKHPTEKQLEQVDDMTANFVDHHPVAFELKAMDPAGLCFPPGRLCYRS
jgi:hypothetical protein